MRRSLVLASAALAVFAGCGEPTCIGTDGCRLPAACEALELDGCAEGEGFARVRVLAPGERGPGGLAALGGSGDILLENDRVKAVIDAIDHPHYLAATGGHLLDLAAGDDDGLTQVMQAVGLLPSESVAYERLEIAEGEGVATVHAHGHLFGSRSLRVTTRYEIRACEPGIRIRTHVYNGSTNPQAWALVDAWYWSGRRTLPFTPGVGFAESASRSLRGVEWEPLDWMAASMHSEPASTYATVSCEDIGMTGFSTEQLSAVGHAPRLVQPREVEVFERFISVSPGRSIANGSDIALEIRERLFDRRAVTLRGRLEATDGAVLGDEVRATLHIDALTPDPSPATQVTPQADGRFSARVPAGARYALEVEAFGQRLRLREVDVGDEDVDLGDFTIEAVASVELEVLVDGEPDHAFVLFHPSGDATREAVVGRLLGGYSLCAPLLGAPVGGSPACNRVLVDEPVTVELLPGRYEVYATVGPFATIDRQALTIEAGEHQSISFSLTRLPLLPEGVLSADFHVHGSASFDSSLPDYDRVQSMLAASLDVVAITDHDVVWDYADARAALDADRRLAFRQGVETTGHIPFAFSPETDALAVIGHWIAWPLPFDPDLPYFGAPWDELVEPGELFTLLARAGWPEDRGVLQLNHPWSPPAVGRDLGFPRAIGVDATRPLPDADDGSAQALINRRPAGSSFSNLDYHVQEVMNGTSNERMRPFRAYWFYLLNQGIVRGGTANSDSHSLTDHVIGTPRTLVFAGQRVEGFDPDAFDAAVREGRMVGTSGPVIEAELIDGDTHHRPGVRPIRPSRDAEIWLRVQAAPWVAVREIRVIIDGRVARTLEAELAHPSDPFGDEGLLRFEGRLSLRELLPDDGDDHWIVIEAGAPLALNGDLDCNGIPDTGDNNDDGVVDWRDVERTGDGVVDEADIEGIEPPPPCQPDATGPLRRPAEPARGEPGFNFRQVFPRAYSTAFTNPFVLDLAGDGFAGPGLLPAGEVP